MSAHSAPGPIVECPDCGDEHRSKRKSGRCTPCTALRAERKRIESDGRIEKPEAKFSRLIKATGRNYG
jgi:hypothetical protein